VRYKKGLAASQVHQIAAKVGFPHVIHFRLATHGGKSPLLCHPFPISPTSPLALEGEAERVLFHNGIWQDWEKYCIETVLSHHVKFPSGKMSDSRAMAWFTTIHGESILNLVDEKVAIFTPTRIEIYGSGWVEQEGIAFSNMHWEIPSLSYWEKGKYTYPSK